MSLIAFDSDIITVRPWEDHEAERTGFDPRSPYVERFWLGILGPSSTWLLRRLAAGFDTAPDGFDLSFAETARSLGLGDRGGRNSPFFRTINRLLQFELAQACEPGQLRVVRRLPPLTRRQTARLSPALQEAHDRWLADSLRVPPAEAARRRSRQLALSLFELGEDGEAVERQLLRWRYHPALARESMCWAMERHFQARAASAAAAAGASG